MPKHENLDPETLERLKSVASSGGHVSSCTGTKILKLVESQQELLQALTQTDTDDWQPWHGGICPLDPSTLVEVRYRNGDKAVDYASALGWKHTNSFRDIVAYFEVKGEASSRYRTVSASWSRKRVYKCLQCQGLFLDEHSAAWHDDCKAT